MLGKNTILKAIHNTPPSASGWAMVWMLGKNTILKAIHNINLKEKNKFWVWMLGKNTILKAIHNQQSLSPWGFGGVNAG